MFFYSNAKVRLIHEKSDPKIVFYHHLPDVPYSTSNSEHKATSSSIYSPPNTPVSNTHHTATPSCFTSSPSHPSSSSPSPPSPPSPFSSSHSSPSSSSSSPQFSPQSSASVTSTSSSDSYELSLVFYEESSTPDCHDTPSSSIDYRQLTTVSTCS